MMSDHRILLYLVNILIFNILIVSCDPQKVNNTKDYITFMSNKLELLSQNEKVILNLMHYSDQLEERLDGVKRLTSYLSQPVRAAKDREEEYLSNPLNVYSLLRQSESDWTQVLRFMEQPIGQEQVNFMREMHKERPSLKSVRDSMSAIHRIKAVYKLNASDLARGIMEGVQHNAKLSALDCYKMGYLYYSASQFEIAAEWLLTARELMYRPKSSLNPVLGVTPSNISTLLAKTYTAIGNDSLAIEVLMEDPELSSSAGKWLEYFKKNPPRKVKNEQLMAYRPEYRNLCSSAFKPKPSRLLCFYKTQPSPFLLLAPFKTEELSLDPLVVVFHDVVYSSEATVLESATESLLQPAAIAKKKYWSSHRAVSGTWLPNRSVSLKDNQLAKRVQQRMKDLSGLIIDDPIHDTYQLLNYGIGGHYLLHRDVMNVTTGYYDDRLATAIVYLNDVVSGGATIFPFLGLSVKAELGKVLFWYNMKEGSYDYEEDLIHGACPVILGNKIILAQWIHEADQMFIKPCRKAPISRNNFFDKK